MPDTLYEDFEDPSSNFEKESRAFVYEIAKCLLKEAKKEEENQEIDDWYDSDKTVKGILLLLFSWNFAAKVTKNLEHKDISKLLDENKNDLKKLEDKTITNYSDKDLKIITNLYENFKDTLKQTGASKALSLLNPKLFVMWDTKIRKRLRGDLIYGISNGEKPKHYKKFIKGVREIIEDYNLEDKIKKDDNIAKKIDEYNYVKIVMNN